jgi:hypothetical protein
MTETCAHCNSVLHERIPIVDDTDLSSVQRMQVGCRKCGSAVCLSCGSKAAAKFGIKKNCLCPKCNAELGIDGYVDEMGEDYYGWGY